MQFVLATYSTMVKLADLDFANDNMTIQERIDVVKKILELLDLIYEDNYENYTIKVHALKSSARLIGAIGLSQKAEALEMAGKEGNIEYIRKHNDEAIDELLS